MGPLRDVEISSGKLADWLRGKTQEQRKEEFGGKTVGLQQRGYGTGSRGERPRERALCEGLFWRSSGFLIWNSLLFHAAVPFCDTPTTLHPTFTPRVLSWRAERNISLGAACFGKWSRGWAYIWRAEHNRKAWNSQGGDAGKPEKPQGSPESVRRQKATLSISICPYPKVFKGIRERTELLYPIQGRDSN